MSVILLLNPLLKFLWFHFFTFFSNHLVNIPLARIIGIGKYAAFAIAILTDIIQMAVYHNVLNNTQLGRRLGLHIDNKLLKDYKKPKFMANLHNSWLYLGVGFLSLLPLYFGGMFVSVFTAYTLKLNRAKSYICIGVGSLIGCFIWTIGVWSLVDLLIQSLRSF